MRRFQTTIPIFIPVFRYLFWFTNSFLLYDIIQHPFNRRRRGVKGNKEGSKLWRNIGMDGIVHMIFFA